jgi:uncharacterized membrane protein
MTVLVLALLIGVVAGLRTMTAPASVSWAAHLGGLPLQDTALSFLAVPVSAYVFGTMALAEFVVDPLPQTPSRKTPFQFGARLVSGALSGAAVGAAAGVLLPGLVAGVIGAAIGTLGGSAARGRLAAAFGRDLPAALIEDAVAVAAAAVILAAAASIR